MSGEFSAADGGNPLLSGGPVALMATVVDTPMGQRMMVTIRTTSTTLTGFLSKLDSGRWIDVLQTEHGKMSSLVVPNGHEKLGPFKIPFTDGRQPGM